MPSRAGRSFLGALLALALAAALLAPSASASFTSAQAAADAGTPVLVTDLTKPPAGYRLTGVEVERIAGRVDKVSDVVRSHRGAHPYPYTKGPGQWQVSWFTGSGAKSKEIAQVYLDDASGKVTQAWTGFQVAWTMARGYPGAFGERVNALYVWLPMCVLFLLPFVPWRRRPTLLHLDLLVLLGFSVSIAYFNHANLGISVPLVYPFLIYLLVRMLLLAAGRGRPREPLQLFVPTHWIAVGIVFLIGFRIGLNVTNSNVIDVGYAGVIGASKLIHGTPLYGHWPISNAYGDTYGPVNYFAYVPFQQIFGWSGAWDSLPAAHAASITFDLLTMLALFLLGRRIAGSKLGIVLAYAWAAYPFSLFVLASDSNDSLVALLLVVTLLAASSAPARGIALALAGLTKFAPLALGPLMLRGVDGGRWRARSVFAYVVAFALTVVAAFLPVLLQNNLSAFWHDSIAYQASRAAPFSVWGLYGGLSVEQHIVQGLGVALALAVAFVPRRRDVVTVAALGAAVIIAIQLGVTYWFYLYIVWFFPLVIVALFGSYPVTSNRVVPIELAGLAEPNPPARVVTP
ncbi:MAG TPA: hypothetical protein VG295_12830 [Solirubrobacteraceae bacterium]|nr:hypothetical protein [Solirubrobacteraceae bacterium]